MCLVTDGEENETDDFEETDALEESETEVVSMPTESETETQGHPEAESVTQDKEAVPEEGKGAPEEAEAKVVSPDEGVVTGSVNGGMEVEDKENNNGRYLETVQPVAVRFVNCYSCDGFFFFFTYITELKYK